MTYVGPFELDLATPYYRDDAPETGGGPLRSVVVFRLRPLNSELVGPSVKPAIESVDVVRDVSVDAMHTDKYVLLPPALTSLEAEKREARLVDSFCKFLKKHNLTAISKTIQPAGKLSCLKIDVYVQELHLLIEAKGTVERNAFRLAIGQLADYRRFLGSPQCAVLVPSRPSNDLMELAKIEGLNVIWTDGAGFSSSSGCSIGEL